eukprot:CAMPEP_0118948766 /NCGR_PEP_ID=MMETSP1169-20130426/48399_1 /TAXON_ID=36882 /ORGANISM="Pyramimonas obovata, Strain CCMP722" /LENGTH=63 /DNA_ID=CAMNT_0006895271 /DNA_START=132 /DNA_END=319 /DNA_ORIENTATION=-
MAVVFLGAAVWCSVVGNCSNLTAVHPGTSFFAGSISSMSLTVARYPYTISPDFGAPCSDRLYA